MNPFIALFTAILFLLPSPVRAQWVKVPPAKIPRTADGKANLSAPAPRMSDGKPDLSGIWEPANNRYVQNIAAELKPEDVPYQAWAKALFSAVLPVPFYFLEILVGLVQAFVFMLLTTVFTALICAHEEEPGKEHH